MEVISLKEYMESVPKWKGVIKIQDLRGCSNCGSNNHHSQMVFLMARKNKGYGSFSTNLCQKCLPRWKEIFRKQRIISSPSEWSWSTWDIIKPFPHHEGDRVLLYIGDNGDLYLQANFNPSKRVKNIIIEEIR